MVDVALSSATVVEDARLAVVVARAPSERRKPPTMSTTSRIAIVPALPLALVASWPRLTAADPPGEATLVLSLALLAGHGGAP